MDEVAQIVQGLRIWRPSITFEQLLALDDPSPLFEAHVAADVGKDYWIFSIEANGEKYLLNGEAMIVRASKSILVLIPDHVETMAKEGLAETIKSLRDFNANTGLQATVEVKELE